MKKQCAKCPLYRTVCALYLKSGQAGPPRRMEGRYGGEKNSLRRTKRLRVIKSALETALAQIEKQFGKGAVMKLGQNVTMQVDAISTGSISLDMALGIGGLPRGAYRRDLRTGSVGQNDAGAALHRRGPEGWRRGCVHRRGTRAGPCVRQGAGC